MIKRLLVLTSIIMLPVLLQAQNYLMGNSNVSTCAGNFRDSGGNGLFGNYGNNENSTMTFCSNTAGQCVRISFTAFDLETNFDFLTIYNGPNTASPLLGVYTGTTSPGTVNGTSGCLTFVFTSDITITSTGWNAAISCVACSAGGPCTAICSGGPAPANDDCSGAQNLGLLPVPAGCPNGNGAWANFNTTNLCATAESPYTTLTGCQPAGNMASPASDVWYRFTITGPTLNIQLSGLQTPNIGLYSGNACNNLVGRGCAIGGGGNLNTSFGGLAAGSYYLQVSGGNLADQCNFTLSMQNNYDCAGCVIVNSLTAIPSPTNGTYQAGQLVNFCYTVSDYNQTSVNWLHAVTPTFGVGWDMPTLTTVMPANCSGQGQWGWYNGPVTSTATGNVFGAGFYYDSNLGDAGANYPDGNPGDNFGDNNAGNTCDWTFCWSVRTKPIAQCVQGASLNIGIDTHGDGESGSWTSLACVGDPITEFFATLVCCQPPIVNVVDPLCPGQNGSANASGQGTAPWNYVWKNATGGNIQITNGLNGADAMNNLPPGNYTVSTTDNTGCTAIANFTIAGPANMVAVVNASPTKCNRTDGGINIIANGGTAPLTYSNNNGASYQAGNIFNNLASGNYTVVVRDANGCTTSQVVNVAPSVIPVINSTPVVNVTCNGGSNGSITINASSGNPAFQYSIDNGITNQATNSFSNLTAGAYVVLVTDVDGCTATVNVNVAQPAIINISNITPTQATCGSNNGSLTITAAGGTGVLQYSVTGGAPYQAANIFNNLAAGNYNVVVIDANGCTQTASPAISNTAAPVINATPVVQLLCNGGNNASITVNASGGTGVLQYSNNNGATFQAGNIFAGLTAGNYDIVVRDAAGCLVNVNIVIASPPAIVINSVPVGAVCTQANGSLQINAVGGTGALQYSINNGATFQAASAFNNLATGNYNIVVRDANGCLSNAVGNIPDAPPPTITSVTPTDIDCNGANNGVINITANGGTAPLEFSINNGGTYQSGNAFIGLAPGNYAIVVRDANGCTVTSNVNIAQPTLLAVNPVPANTTCSQSNGTIMLNANGGTPAYQYSIDGGATFQAANNFAGLAAGNYSLVVTDANGCIINSGANIVDAPGPRIDATAITNVDCFGANNGAITVTASSGTAPLQYSNNNGTTFQAGNNFAGLAPGAYTIIVRDANGCTATIIDNIVQPTQVAISGTPVVNVVCNGGNTGSIDINANGGTAPLQYSITGGAPYQAGNNFPNLTSGNYTATVIDANGCSTTSPVNVAQPTAVAITGTPSVDVDCNGANNGTITINANGGTAPLQYSINNGATYQAGNAFNNLAPANYTIVVQDANGCTATSAVNIIQPTAVAITGTPSVDVDCNGANNGIITINANGGTAPLQYSINNGATYQAGNAFNNLAPANYTIVVQDANGCTATSAVNIIQPTAVAITGTPSVDVDCNGANNGIITINANGGTAPLQYSINNGATYQAGNAFNNLAPANYAIVVQDANGCTATSAVVIVQPTAVVIAGTPSVDVDCNGANNGSITINANGGTAPLQYSINNGATYQAGNAFNNLAPANYTIVVQDANGCTATSAVVIIQPTAVAITGTPSVDVDCNGANNGTITINANGGTAPLQYSINNGATYQAGNTFNNLAPANYAIVVQDANGCTATSAVNIIQPTAVVIAGTPSVDVDCNGANNGSITINANGGTAPLQYSINNGATYQAGNAFNNLAPANYTIVVQDANGCTATSAVVIIQPTAVVIAGTPSVDIDCNGANNGTITVNANGGTAPLQYSINNGATYQAGNAFNNLAPANYTIVVQDANGCTATSAVNILQPTAVVIAGTPSVDVDCNGANNGSITINANGGTAPLQYSINNGATYQAGNAFNNLAPANYAIVVQDANGCTATSAVNIIQPTAVVIAGTPSVDVDCNGANNGSITINANGGTAPLQYSIDNGATYQAGNAFNNLAPSNYAIVVQDANGCTATSAVNIIQPTAVVIAGTPSVDVDCNGANNGTITINANGGTAPLQYSIDNGATYQAGNAFNNLAPANYAIVVQDANGCTATSAVNIIQPTAVAITGTPSVDVDCNGANNGTITINANGGTAPLQYSIDNGATYQAGNAFNNLAPANYAIVVQDANGCTATSSVNIIQPTALALNTNVVDANCGNANGAITVVANGGTAPLQYSNNNGATYQAGNNFNALLAGNYQIVVMDANGCSISTNTAVQNLAAPIINATPFTDITCNGANNGSITVNANGGTGALQYSINNGTTFSAANIFNNLAPGNYQIVVEDAAGCQVVANVVIAQPAALVVAPNITGTTCSNANGNITLNANGGTAPYQYSNNNGASYQAGNAFNNIASGNYTVVVQDDNGCTVSQAVAVNNAASPAINNVAHTDLTCNGSNNGTITITTAGGTAPLQYSINNGTTYQSANNFNTLPIGNYQIIVQDANGCTATSNAAIIQPAAIVVNLNTTPSTCGNPDGSLTVNANGGTGVLQYSINNGVTYQASSSFGLLVAGNYTIIAQDVNGCTGTAASAINNLAAPAIITTPLIDVTCNGGSNGSITINANGGTGALQYSINNGATYQAANIFNNLPQGNYSIVVQDANGCTVTSAVVINEPTPIVVVANPTGAICSAANGNIVINANGGTGLLQYSIDNGATYQMSATFNNITSGNYNIVVKDANSCIAAAIVNVANAPGPIVAGVPVVDVTCNGGNDGSITVNANGGTAPLQYSNDNGVTYQAANNFANLIVGNYQVVVIDDNGCTSTALANVIEPTAIIVNVNTVASTCGNSDGSLSIAANGGTGALQYSINNGLTWQPSVNFNLLIAGNYTVLVQDANGCTSSMATVVNNQAAPAITATPSVNVDCNGANNGTITINANGGTGALQYSINNGATYQPTNNFTNLAPGNYTIVVQDANGCTATSAVPIIEPAAIVVNPNITGTTCSIANGSIIINAIGGTGALQYSINNGATYQAVSIFNSITSGAYQIIVQDANGCTSAANANVVDAPAANIVSTPVNDVSCNGLTDGTILINALGGTAPLQYSINNGATYQATNNFGSLAVGNYQIVVTDANGCTTTAAANIAQPAAINVNANTVNANCGQADGSLNVVANGGTGALQFSIDGGVSFQSAATFNFLVSGNYNVIVQDANGCTNSIASVVNSNAAPAISNVNAIDINCNGANNGSITITANGGTGALQYSINNGATYQAGNNFTNLSPGNYAVVVQDVSGCTITSGAIIVEPALLMLNSNATTSTCGNANGTLTMNANGGTSPLQYSNDNGATYQALNNFSSLASGNYQIIVQDANGCTTAGVAVVASAPSPVINNVAANDISCNGANDGTIAIASAGGTAPLQFSIDNGATYQAANNFGSLANGNYQIIIQDANGCTATSAAVIAQPAAIVVNANTVNSNCNQADGSVTIVANGGSGSLQYSIDAGVSFQPSATFNFLPSGNYNIIVQDANGCSNNVAAVVNNNAAPAISVVNAVDINCNGANNGTITITANGGTGVLQYSINNGSTYQAANNFTNLFPGNYAVVVQDASGCTVTSAAIIIEPALLVLNSNTATSTCGNANGTLIMNANGGTAPLQYSNDNGTTYQPLNNFNNLAAGNYQIIVQDANGCSTAGIAVVASAPSPLINNVAATDLTCNASNDGTIAIASAGGTAPLQFSINNGATYQAANNFSNLANGNYQILIQDANGCTATSATVIAQPAAINYAVVAIDAICGNNNGTLTINANGGAGSLQYSINGGVSFQSGNIFNNLLAGVYPVVVQDANGCSVNGNSAIANVAAPIISAVPVVDATCNGQSNGSVTINVNGGTGALTYSINGGITIQASNSFPNLPAGNYNIVVTDAAGCSVVSAAVVNEPAAINVNVNTTTANCGVANGTITIAANGGVGALQYSNNNGTSYQPTGNFNNQLAGNYNVIVQDANGCTIASVASVNNTNAPIIASTPSVDITCNGANNGSITINANGGTGALQYSINNGATYIAANVFNNLPNGVYSIVVLDAAGCQATTNVNIIEPPAIIFNSVPTASTCGNTNGSILINALGGTAPLQYSNNNGSAYQATNNFINLAASNYNIVVQDANGCSVTAIAAVANLSGPAIAAANAVDVTCNGLNNGTITVNANGGSGVLQYSNDNGATWQAGNIFNNLSPGNYQIAVQDANGCPVNSAAVIAQPSAVVLNANAIGTTCSNANGTVNVVGNGGTGALQYSINNGITYQAATAFTNLLAGNYSVIAQDANGCTTTAAIIVNDAPAPTITNALPVDANCYGANNGTITITANGGTAPLQYSINNGTTYQPTNNFANLAIGNYQIIVTDVNGCSAASTALIAQPQQINYVVATTQSTCGNANGGVTINNVTGGTGVYQYSIDNGATWQALNTFANIAAGNYQVVVQDVNGCNIPGAALVVNQSGPSISAVNAVDVLCNGGSNGSITITQTGGTGPFQFSINNGTTYQSGNLFSNLAIGNYSVIVQDANGCTAASPSAIAQPTAVVLNANAIGTTCSNANGTVNVVGNGGTGTLQYSIDNGITYQAATVFANLLAGNYSVIAQDANGCTASSAIIVNDAPAPTITNALPVDANCYGANNGTITITANGGTAPLQYSIDNGATYQATNNFGSLAIGNYQIVVTDANGCSVASTTLIAQPQQINYVVATTPSTCGNANGGITINNVTGGTGVCQYSINNGTTFQAINNFSNLTVGNYNVIVQDANGCNIPSVTAIVNIPGPVVSALAVTDVDCFGNNSGDITITPQGGTGPFQFSIDNGTTFQGGNLFNSLLAGNYQIVILDANGCDVDSAIAIAQPPVLNYNVASAVATCGNANGNLSLAATGGSGAYQFSINGGITYQPSGSFTNLAPTLYNIVVQDANGCQSSGPVNITSAPSPVLALNATTDVTCFGLSNGSASVSTSVGTAPFTYSIDGGATYQPLSNFNNLTAGNYTIIVQDLNGCLDSVVAPVNQPAQIVLQTAATPALCYGGNTGTANVVANGGVAPYVYNWSGGAGSNPVAANLIASTYTVTVTDANNCPMNSSVVVNEPTALQLASSFTNATCFGLTNGTISLSASGGTGALQYSVNNGTSYQSSNQFANLTIGGYQIVVMDANGCTIASALNIAQPAQILANSVATPVSCFGGTNGTVTVNANGGTGPLQYSINNGTSFQTPNNFPNLSSGNYTVVVQDANGCSNAAAANVTQPTLLTSNANAVNILCFGQTNGSVTVIANGGTPPYSYLWTGGAVSSSVANLSQGTYSVTVTDANGCIVASAATIAQPTAIAAAIAAVPTICIGQNSSLTASATGGVAPYTFKWNTGYIGNPLAVAPAITTNYNVVVNDANGCTAAPVYRTIDVHPALAVVVSPNDTICQGESVSLTANPSGGNGGPYTFNWTGATSASNNIVVSPILTSTYIVTINDGCTVLPANAASTVKVNPLPEITFAPDPAEGCVPLTVNFSNTTINGIDFKWQFGDGNTSSDSTPTHIYLQSGVYDVTLEATSAEGCYNIFVMDNAVNVFDNPIANFEADPPRTSILNPQIQFKDLSIGANRWQWNFGDVFGTSFDQHPSYTYRDTGTYSITLIVQNNELCADTTYGEIIIDGDFIVYIPNAFTPNFDGRNDIFNVYGYGIVSADINIFDRWGNLIHTHHNPYPHWNGKNQADNKMCQEGVYVYVLKAKDLFNKEHVYKGTVTLLK